MSNINYLVIAEEETNLNIEDNKEPEIVKELVEKREENIKHFELADGTFQSVTYENPVHYEEDGVMREIDNRLHESIDKDNGENDEVYENTENSFKVKISKNVKSDKLVRIEKDGYKLIWGLNDASIDGVDMKVDDFKEPTPEYVPMDATNPEVKKELDKLSENDEKAIVPGITSIVNFEGIRKNVDLQYVVDSSKVKENIILKEYVENPEFTFVYQTKGLKAKLKENNSVVFYDEKDESKDIMLIEKPLMYDAKGELCDDIKVELNEVNKNYQYKLIPNNEWLADSSREYPVTIDPPIETEQDAATAHETSVFPVSPYRMASTAGHFWIGYGDTYKLNQAYVKFKDIPVLSNAFEVKKAYIDMYNYINRNSALYVNVYPVLSSWNHDTITWDNKPDYGNKISEAYIGGPEGAKFTWDITKQAKKWCSGSPNYGLIFRLADQKEKYNFGIYSSDCTTASKRPLVKIHYGYKAGIKQYLGRVEAESSSSYSEGVAVIASNYASQGHYVDGLDEGKYLKLIVHSKKSGVYDVGINLSSSAGGSILKAIVNEGGLDQYETNIAVEATGNDTKWKVHKARLRLHSGENIIKIAAYKGGGWLIDYLEFTHNLPDTIEAENFCNASDYADIQVYDNLDTGVRKIGQQRAGEYYDYKVKVKDAGQYKMNFIVASGGTTGKFSVYNYDGSTEKAIATGISVPDTGDYNKFTTVSKDVYLTKDIKTIRIKVTGDSWDLDKFECVTVGPRTIKAEEYYATNGADTSVSSDKEQFVASIDEGNYISYRIVLRSAGTYNLGLKVASARTDGVIRVEDDSNNVLAKYIIPKTSEVWNTKRKWYDINKNIKLKAGVNTIKFVAESLNWDLESLTLSHKAPAIIEAQDISDTNTALIENSMVTFKTSQYVDYNVWVQDAGKYTIGVKSGDGSGAMEINVEDTSRKVLGTVAIPAVTGTATVVKKVIELKEGYNSIRLFNKSGTGTLKTLSIEKGENLSTTINIPGESTEPDNERPVVDRKAMNYPREGHVVEEANGKLYAIGGKNTHIGGILKSVEVYNQKFDVWELKEDMPEALYGAVSSQLNGKIYIIGGENKTGVTNSLYVYDTTLTKAAWANKTSMLTKRVGHSAALVDGKIYVMGGYDGNKYVNTVEVYDIASNTWAVKSNLPIAMVYASAESVNGKVYITGGKNLADKALKSIYEYTPTTDKWVKKADMGIEKWGHATAVLDSKIFTIGGMNNSLTGQIEVYNPSIDSWARYKGLTGARFSIGAGVVNKTIFVTGGHNFADGGVLAKTEILAEDGYNLTPSTGVFKSAVYDTVGYSASDLTEYYFADINGDKKADKIYWNCDNDHGGNYPEGTLKVYMGNGDGTFKSAVYDTVGYSTSAKTKYYFADINGDGLADKIYWNYAAEYEGLPQGSLKVYIGKGDGTFKSAVYDTVGYSASEKTKYYFTDVNKDGLADKIYWNYAAEYTDVNKDYPQGLLKVYIGKGDGTFKSAIYDTVGYSASEKTKYYFADVNGDSIPDKIYWNYSTDHSLGYPQGTLKVYIGKTDGTHNSAIYDTNGWSKLENTEYYFADLNGDGLVDKIYWNSEDEHNGAYQAGSLKIYMANGDGSFTDAFYDSVGWSESDKTKYYFADINGDGKNDKIYWNYNAAYEGMPTGSLKVYINNMGS